MDRTARRAVAAARLLRLSGSSGRSPSARQGGPGPAQVQAAAGTALVVVQMPWGLGPVVAWLQLSDEPVDVADHGELPTTGYARVQPDWGAEPTASTFLCTSRDARERDDAPVSDCVDAVLVSRTAGACENCDAPLVIISDEMELGTVLRVDRSTRQMIPWSRGHVGELEAVILEDRSGWVPTEVLRYEGRPL